MKNQSKTENAHGTAYGESQETLTSDKNLSGEPRVRQIEGLPFATVKDDNNSYAVVFGKYMISANKFISHEAAVEWCHQTDWLTILNVVGIYIEEQRKLETLKNN